MKHTARVAVGMMVAITSGGFAGEVEGQGTFRMDRDEEIRLAMSAGPISVSERADVYAFGARGFEKVLEGTNGFACMVIRAASDPAILAPHCFSPDAVESVLPAKLAEGRLIAAGRSAEEVEAELMKGFESGTLPIPSGQAYAYMLSGGQKLGPAGQWRPHFMLYMPYADNDDVGGRQDMPAFPFVGPELNHPHSTMVIVMTEFVDPADVPARR